MKLKPKTPWDKGFTLLEIMIAMAIFSIGILGLSKLHIASTSSNTSSRGYSEASTLGQMQLETLMSLPYDDALLSDTDGDGTNQDADNDGVDDSGNNFGLEDTTTADQSTTVNSFYNLFWNIAEDEPIDGTKRICLIVQWQSSMFSMRQITFNTVKVSM